MKQLLHKFLIVTKLNQHGHKVVIQLEVRVERYVVEQCLPQLFVHLLTKETLLHKLAHQVGLQIIHPLIREALKIREIDVIENVVAGDVDVLILEKVQLSVDFRLVDFQVVYYLTEFGLLLLVF